MNDKELKENIEKIKQLLTLPDYDKIDAGIELAVSLEEPKVFEELLKGCVSIIDLNNWMKMNDIQLTDQEAQFYDNLPDGFVFTDDKDRQEKHLFRQNQLILIKCEKRMLEVFGE